MIFQSLFTTSSHRSAPKLFKSTQPRRLNKQQGLLSLERVARAIRFMSETAPEVASRVLLDQIVKELMAAERLRVVETKRDHGRITGNRKDTSMRLPTT